MSSKKITLFTISSLLIAGIYYFSGILVKPLILPPNFLAPFWPAAGIAVGALILWGYKYIPAIIVGEILINYDFNKFDQFSDQPTLIITYSTMLLAIVLRSVIGAYLVKRYLGQSNNYLTLQSTLKLFILAGLIPTFISTTITTFTLFSSSLMGSYSIMAHFLTCWFRDAIGIVIILPLMFVIFKKPREYWRPRLFKTIIPVLITFLLLVFMTLNLKQLENKRLVESLNQKAELLIDSIYSKLSRNKLNLHSMSNEQLIPVINRTFIDSTENIVMNKGLQDIHFIVYSVNETGNTILFESNNKTKKLSKWSASRLLSFAKHEWLVVAYTTPQYYSNSPSWLIWWLSSIGFLFIALLGAGLFVTTGYTILIKDKVKERTKEIETLNKILIESEGRYKQLIEIQPVILWKQIIGEDSLDFISDEAVSILGYPKKDIVRLDFIWQKLIHPEDRVRVLKEYRRGLKLKNRFSFKYRVICKNGNILWFKDYAFSQMINGMTEVVGLKIDITNELAKEQEITQLAYYDTMTKLPNRDKFMIELKKSINLAIEKDTYGAILYLDLDRFKVLNDSMGHHFGDFLLVQITSRLKGLLRENDVLSRFGGDEFVILMSNNNKSLDVFKQKIQTLTKKIKTAMNSPFTIENHKFYTSFSIGISLFPYDSINPEDAIRQADMAMYISKNAGKNTHTFFEEYMQENANKRLSVEKSLKNALSNNEYEMYFQPIVDANNETIKLEALIRWNHSEQGLLLASKFIKISEDIGHIIELSEWIFDKVFATIKGWKSSGYKSLPISINLSLFQFHSATIINALEKSLKTHAINPNKVILEITETIGIEDYDDALRKLTKLKEIGFKIAIDDFGTGFSSLNYLSQMPIDILKLDKSFLTNLSNKDNSEKLIEMILIMGKQLKLDVIVEGVETEQQFSFLKRLGCQEFQGFLFSKALPVNEVEKLISNADS